MRGYKNRTGIYNRSWKRRPARAVKERKTMRSSLPTQGVKTPRVSHDPPISNLRLASGAALKARVTKLTWTH